MTFSADAVKEISENRNGGVSAAFGKLILVWALVVVKWSACSPITPNIQGRIQLKSTIL